MSTKVRRVRVRGFLIECDKCGKRFISLSEDQVKNMYYGHLVKHSVKAGGEKEG
ncbi:MAG: hypothetical protein QXP58_06920 [Thermoprotei archaeon]